DFRRRYRERLRARAEWHGASGPRKRPARRLSDSLNFGLVRNLESSAAPALLLRSLVQDAGLAIVALGPGMERNVDAVERVLQADALAHRVARGQQMPCRIVPERFGDGVDERLGNVGPDHEEGIDPDRLRLRVEAGIGPGRDVGAGEVGIALPQ